MVWKKGDYYMVVTLPSDLSERAASILTDNPQQMKIDYQTSSGHSFIAGKMSDSAMTFEADGGAKCDGYLYKRLI